MSNQYSTLHGLSRHPLYGRWYRMVRRCTVPDEPHFNNYGGRGIRVHPDWVPGPSKYITYVETALGHRPGPEYSIDRIDNEGHYEPGNLRWATRSVQNANQRQRTSPGYPIGHTGYAGVKLHRVNGTYQARLHIGGRQRSLGYYKTALAAAQAYDAEARRVHGARARLNFPELVTS